MYVQWPHRACRQERGGMRDLGREWKQEEGSSMQKIGRCRRCCSWRVRFCEHGGEVTGTVLAGSTLYWYTHCRSGRSNQGGIYT